MNKLRFFLLLIFCTILIGNIPVGADEQEEVTEEVEETEEVSFKKAVSDFAKSMKAVRKYILAQAEKRKFEESEINLLAEIIYWENWYTDKDKLTARWTGGVVMNRVHSDSFPNTVYDVAYQKGQYSTTKKFYTQELPEECYEMARNVYYNGVEGMPENVLFQATFVQGKVWKRLNGEVFCYG